MKKQICVLSFFMIVTLSLIGAEDNFSDLNDAQKLDLSEAYQAVGEHFGEIGEATRGASYEKTAQYLREQIVDLSEAALAKQQIRPSDNMAPSVKMVSENEKKAVNYYFKKIVRSLLSENKDKLLAGIDSPFALEGFMTGIPAERLDQDITYLFEAYDLTVFEASDLYVMDDISFSYDNGTNDVIILEVKAANSGDDSFLGEIIFWKDVQRFYFKRTGTNWKLFAIL